MDELLARDARAHVMYLRSFGIDVRLHRVPGGFLQRGTEEEQLVWALNRIGPVVAVGRSGEALPELGAARLYLENLAWQSEVMRLMDGAALVVLLPGSWRWGLWRWDSTEQWASRACRGIGAHSRMLPPMPS